MTQVSDRGLPNSVEYLDRLFASADADPWGINWRGSQLVRRRRVARWLAWQARIHKRLHAELIVDIGCAAGETTSDLVGALQPERVLALDISPAAIATARRRYADLPVEWVAGDYRERGPWQQPSTIVIASLVAEYMPDSAATIAFYRRIREQNLTRPWCWLIVVEDVLPGTPQGIPESEVDRQLREAGFAIVATHRLHGRLANQDRRFVAWSKAERWRGVIGRAMLPLLKSTTLFEASYLLSRLLLGRRGVDRVVKIARPA